jgi:hypothetical protein
MSLSRSTKDLSFLLNKVTIHARPGATRALCAYFLYRQSIFVGCRLIFLTDRSAHPRSILVFHLKQYHRIRPDSSIGSIHITVEELLDHCRNDERMSCCISYSCCDFHSGSNVEATLELRDSRNNVSGCLIVEIRESDAVQAGKAAVSSARRDVAERGIATSNPIQDAVDDALGLAAPATDIVGPVTISIKQIVQKTKVIVDFIDEAAKVSISAG